MKLSEQLTLRNMAGEKVSAFDFDAACELEAEVERLHEDVTGEHSRAEAYAAVARQACAETDAYREAVAEVLAILARESEPWSHKLRDMHVVLDTLFGEERVHAASLVDILDRLPRGAT